MRNSSITILIIITALASVAQDTGWNYSVDANVTVALSTFSSNWTGNDAGTLVWVSRLNATARRALNKRLISENSLKLNFGQTKVQNKTTKRWSSPEKSSDDINLQTVMRFPVGQAIDPFLGFTLNSQFLDNRYDREEYLNPMELTQSFGMAREILKRDKMNWNLRIGCATRQSINKNFRVPGDSITPFRFKTDIVKDGGGELVSELKYKNNDMISIFSKIRIFEAFISSKAEKLALNNHWRYPDITWESILQFNLTRNILFSYNLILIYDRDVDEQSRIKQTLGAGLSINLSSRKK